MHFKLPRKVGARFWPVRGARGVVAGLIGGMMLVAPVARAQDATYPGVTGGTVSVGGNLYTDGMSFTHAVPGSASVTGGLLAPNLTNVITSGGNATLGNVTVSGATSAEGDIWVSDLYGMATGIGGTSFLDNNDQTSGTIYFGGLNFSQGGAQLSVGSNGILTITDNATGNRLAIRPSDFTLSVLGSNHTGVISLLGGGAVVTSYSGGNLTLDFASEARPFVQLFGSEGSVQLAGNASAATLEITQAGGGGVSVSPTGQAISFSSGLVVSGNTATAPFGNASVALGGSAGAPGPGAVAVGAASANGNLAIALGDNSTTTANGAVALAGGEATAGQALAMGMNSSASATGATAIGPGTAAQSWGAVVVGHNNLGVGGNSTGWAAGDPAFVVGVGADGTSGGQANAMVIYNNGNVNLGGPANLTNSGKTLQVNGPAIMNGQATFSGGVILAHPQGDISAGIYSN